MGFHCAAFSATGVLVTNETFGHATILFPEDTGELIRVLTLSKLDIAFVRQHRGDHNRFGIAVLMAYLRYPGRILAKDEKPHAPVLDLIAEQLQIPTAAWELYADRDEPRREHLVELLSL